MPVEVPIAFATREIEPPGLEIRVNFGMFSGRKATPAEIDELAARLLPKIEEVSIVAEERHEIGEETEAALHQIRIEVQADHVPADERDADVLAGRLVEAAESWARECFAERHVSEL
ncbi:MAG: hypothetical protein WBB74_11025 [Gaiellaceae bacterium]